MHISILFFLALSLKLERFLAQLVAEGAKDSAEEYLDGHGAREDFRRNGTSIQTVVRTENPYEWERSLIRIRSFMRIASEMRRGRWGSLAELDRPLL
jgi:hypothetical protein